MTKKQQTTIQALTDMLSDNLGQIQNHLEEVGHFVKMKLACIDELNRVNAELEARAVSLKNMGERPPVPTETRSPKSSKAS